MFTTLFAQVGLVAALSACIPALVFGGRPEKVVGGAVIIAWLATAAAFSQGGVTHPFNSAVVTIDTLLLALLVSMSLSFDKRWLLFASAYQLLTTLADFVLLVDLRIGPRGYVAAMYLSSYLTLLALSAGTWTSWAERRKLTNTSRR